MHHDCISIFFPIFFCRVFLCVDIFFCFGFVFGWILFVRFYLLHYWCVCIRLMPFTVRSSSSCFSALFWPVDVILILCLCMSVFIIFNFVTTLVCMDVYTTAERLHSFSARIYQIQSNRFSCVMLVLNLNTNNVQWNGRNMDFYKYFNRRLSNLFWFFMCAVRSMYFAPFFAYTLTWPMNCYLLLNVCVCVWLARG